MIQLGKLQQKVFDRAMEICPEEYKTEQDREELAKDCSMLNAAECQQTLSAWGD